MEHVEEACRGCLKNCVNDLVKISDIAVYSKPRKRYIDVLKELAKLKTFGDLECNIPQNLCSECCRQVYQMYLFVKQIQRTNQELSHMLDLVDTGGGLDVMFGPNKVKMDLDQEICSSGVEEHFLEIDVKETASIEGQLPVECENGIEQIAVPYVDILKSNYDNHDNDESVIEEEEEILNENHCDNKYETKKNTDQHLIELHQDELIRETETYNCNSCNYSARTLAGLHFHKRSKHGSETDKFKCKFCTYTSIKKFDLFSHTKKSHLSIIKILRKQNDLETNANESNLDSDVPSNKCMEDIIQSLSATQNQIEMSTEFCSTDDEQFIRDILCIKRRSRKSHKTDKTMSAKTHPHCQEIYHSSHVDNNELLNFYESHTAIISIPSEGNISQNKEQIKQYTNDENSTKHQSNPHMLPTKTQKMLQCQLCDYTTKTSAALHFHKRSKHGTDEDKINCHFCPYIAIRKYDLLHHIIKCHLAIVKSIKREILENTSRANHLKDTTTEPDMISEDVIQNLIHKHKNSESNDKAITDESLEASSGDETTIRQILRMKKRGTTSELTSSLPRRCEECGNIYKNSKALHTHRRMMHVERDYSQCPHCECKYKRAYDLKLHIKAKHLAKNLKPKNRVRNVVQDKRYMCTECSYVCSTLTCLTIHTYRHHTGEKPHQCEFCPKAFVVKADLKTHRYMHTGERPYKCPICAKGFRDRNHMERHRRIHLDVKPYSCTECGKGFTKTYNLKVHQRTHTKEQRPRCQICSKYFKDQAQLNVHQISEDHHEEVI